MKAFWRWFGPIASVSMIVAYVYFLTVDQPTVEVRRALHEDIIRLDAVLPYRYRVLVPFLVEVLITGLEHLISRDAAFVWGYAIYDFAAVFVALAALYFFLRRWFTEEQSLIGTLVGSVSMLLSLRDHFFQPWSILEVAFFCWALAAMVRRRYLLLSLIVLLSSFNRETTIFLPLAFLITAGHLENGRRPSLPRAFLLAGGYGLIWLACFGGMFYFFGSTRTVETLGEIWATNMSGEGLRKTAQVVPAFLGLFWIFAVLGVRRAPSFLRRAAFVVPIYLGFMAVVGVWYEVRLLMPMYPILLGLGLSFLFGPATADRMEPIASANSSDGELRVSDET